MPNSQGLMITRVQLREGLTDNSNALFRLAYSWCHDRVLAQDLAQQALCKALERAQQLRKPSSLKPWLFQILARCFADHCRQREPDCITEDIGTSAFDPAVLHGRAARVHRVRSAMAQLPLAQRQVMTLVDLEGLTYREVADTLSLPVGTVMSRISRAREKLRVHLLAADSQLESRESKVVALKT
ncbi:MAG: RNA polymerase sigma factor [Gammaproteobacteria bacterium]|nr:RNA polymerase sigma factor [Gammaproteobacteria bacterium]